MFGYIEGSVSYQPSEDLSKVSRYHQALADGFSFGLNKVPQAPRIPPGFSRWSFSFGLGCATAADQLSDQVEIETPSAEAEGIYFFVMSPGRSKLTAPSAKARWYPQDF